MAGEARPLTAVDASGEPLEPLDLEAEEADSITRQRQLPSRLRWAALLSVPMLWGSFTPTMKLLLNVKRPPPALVTNLCSHVVGAITLCIITLVTRPPPHCLGSSVKERRRMLRASLELGVYLFFGQLTQLLGLQGTTATVNAVLVQASVVIVPLFDTAEAPVRKASRLAVVAARLLPSLIALGGVVVLTSAPSAEGAGTALKEEEATLGIVFSLVSAVCYAMHTMRLSEYSDVDPTAQAAGQVLVNALLDVAAMPVAAMLTTANEGAWLASLTPTLTQAQAQAQAPPPAQTPSRLVAGLRPPRGPTSPRPRRLLERRLRGGGHHLGHELRTAGAPSLRTPTGNPPHTACNNLRTWEHPPATWRITFAILCIPPATPGTQPVSPRIAGLLRLHRRAGLRDGATLRGALRGGHPAREHTRAAAARGSSRGQTPPQTQTQTQTRPQTQTQTLPPSPTPPHPHLHPALTRYSPTCWSP